MKRSDRCHTVTAALATLRDDEELEAFLTAMTWSTAMPATDEEKARMAELRRGLLERRKAAAKRRS